MMAFATMENSSFVVESVVVNFVEDSLQYFPDNPIADPLERFWVWMTSNYTKFQIVTFGTLLCHEIIYFGICAPTFIFQFIPFMRRFKIQDDKPETFDAQWKCFKLLMFNHFCIQLPMISGFFVFMEMFGTPYDWNNMPRWYDTLVRIYLSLIIEDTWHYFMHRALHDPRIYKYIHKVQHHFQSPFGIVAGYAHPAEIVISAMGTMWCVLLFFNHLIFAWVWMTVRQLETIDVHSGYDLPYINPFHLLPGYAGSRFHDFHHYNFNGNYAPTFVWWDRICGTDVQYKAFLASKAELESGKKSE